MTEMLDQYNPLRSQGSGLLVVPRAKSKQVESHYAVERWNKLPGGFRNAPYLAVFKSRLKTLLVSHAFTLNVLKSKTSISLYIVIILNIYL